MVSYCSPLLYPLGISSEYRLPLSGLSFPFPPDAPPLFPVPLMLDLDLCWWSNRSSCCCCGSFNPGYDRSLGLGRPASISGEMRSVISYSFCTVRPLIKAARGTYMCKHWKWFSVAKMGPSFTFFMALRMTLLWCNLRNKCIWDNCIPEVFMVQNWF